MMILAPDAAKWDEEGRCWMLFVIAQDLSKLGWFMVLPNESTPSERDWVYLRQFE